MKRLSLALTVAIATFGASFPTVTQSLEPPIGSRPIYLSQAPALPAQLRERVLQVAAQRTGRPATTLQIEQAVQLNWEDGCLGLGQPGETCTQGVVPGWWIVVTDGPSALSYRTNNQGTVIRPDLTQNFTQARPVPSPTPTPVPTPTPAPVRPINPVPITRIFPDSLRDLAVYTAAEQTGQPITALQVTESIPEDWPDGCLGLGQPNEFCTQVIVPGWRVTVSDGQDTLIYRLDNEGVTIRAEEIIVNGATIDVANELPLLPDSVADLVKETAASETDSRPSRFELVRASQAIWPDGCLGLPRPNEFCTQMTVRGWDVAVKNRRSDRERLYRTDALGLVARLDTTQVDTSQAAQTPQSENFQQDGWNVALYWARELSAANPKVIVQLDILEKPPTLYANAVYQLFARWEGRWVNVYSNLGARLIRNQSGAIALVPEVIDLGEYAARENRSIDWSKAQLRAVVQIRYDLSPQRRDLRLTFEETGRYRELAIVNNPILVASPLQPLNPIPPSPINSPVLTPSSSSFPGQPPGSANSFPAPTQIQPVESLGTFNQPEPIYIPIQPPPIQ